MVIEPTRDWVIAQRDVKTGKIVERPVEFFLFVPVQTGRQGQMSLETVVLVLDDGTLQAVQGKLRRSLSEPL